MRVSRAIGLAVVLTLIATSLSLAAVPQTMNVQGRLTDDNGNPITGPATLIFKIYTTPIDPRDIWPQQTDGDEAHSVTLGPDGLWSVEIGTEFPITTSVYSDSSRWLEVEHLETATVFPRIHMSSGAYSYRVSTVDNATGGDIFGDVYLHSTFYVGDLGNAGHVVVRDATTFPQVKLDGEQGTVQGRLGVNLVETIDGDVYAGLGRNGSGGGVLRTWDENNSQTTIMGSSSTGGGGFANFHLETPDWGAGVTVDGDDGNSGRITMSRTNAASIQTGATIDADAGDGGANISLYEQGSETFRMDASGGGGGGGMLMWNSLGNNTVEIDADETNDAAAFRLFDGAGNERVEIIADETDNAAQMVLRNSAGAATIILDAAQGTSARITTQLLQITGGADLSEQFDIAPHANGIMPAPGMVVCLDPANPGKLVVSGSAYDRTVAGIVSGAGGVHPGMLMGQSQSEVDGRFPVALTGRVYVMADASNGPIQVGDLLTTSDVPGHAMKVTNYDHAHGAIIGKAMSTLDDGRGLVLALVTLH